MSTDWDWEDSDEDAFEGPDGINDDDEEMDPENHIIAESERAVLNDDDYQITGSSHFNLRPRDALRLLLGFRMRGSAEDESDEELERRLVQTPPPVGKPQEAGSHLLMSGEFGRIGKKTASRRENVNIARILTNPPALFCPASYKEDISGNLVPNCNGTAVALYNANIYSGQFSTDSSLYYTCAQDYKLRVYDMKAAPHHSGDYSHRSTMKLINTIQGQPGRWTITDSHLSPDDQRIIYSSITPTVYLANTFDPSTTTQIPISFADSAMPNRRFLDDYDFGIWSCRFSADGNEVIAGGDGNLFVYDLLANRRTVKISAHGADVNSCCWADTASGNVLVSASDDTFLKVWDRRSLGMAQKPSGVLIGHTEGITYVSAKGDGRYLISNGKDQALRLWDLRKIRSNAEFEAVAGDSYGTQFDYRYGQPPKRIYTHPQDCSVMTYRGHSVLHTLIRCHFSPAETTGGQYLYSGSANGKIHIWSLDGRVVQVLDRGKVLSLPSDFLEPGFSPRVFGGRRVNVCVRDVSWHSQEPVIMSTGWESGSNGSIVARHEWKGLSKARQGSLEDWVEKERQERTDTSTRRTSRRQRR